MASYPPPTNDVPIFDSRSFLSLDEALIEELRLVLPNLSAVAPNNNNPFVFAINDTLNVKNADSNPTGSISIDADNSGTDFGLYWASGGVKPFVMTTLDATALQVRDTTLQLYDTLTPQTTDITATSISIVGGNNATWANIINNVGGGIPSINQVLFVGSNASNQAIIDLNGIGIVGGTNLYNNSLAFVGSAGAITDLATINGVAYPPTPTTPALSSVLSAGNNTGGYNIDFGSVASIDNVLNINGFAYPPVPVAPYGLTGVLTISDNAGALNITNVNDIGLSSINGSAYPPTYPTPDLASVLSAGNSVGSTPINMNSQDIQSCNDITLVSINGVPFLPAKFSGVFPAFNVGPVSNNSTNYGGTGVNISAGNYQITYTIQFDGNITQGGGSYYMVRGYCFLFGVSFGIVNPTIVNNGFYPSQTISYSVGSGYYNCLTTTDYITINNNDTFQLGAYQSNEQGQTSSTCYISAVIQAV